MGCSSFSGLMKDVEQPGIVHMMNYDDMCVNCWFTWFTIVSEPMAPVASNDGEQLVVGALDNQTKQIWDDIFFCRNT